ncbi:hypothetical protein HZI73_06715 [Vallitalea pronyensis]|uniref:Uncharacterized protein n=1 Tax=Vallitalea pronyensis TaxID=1348613 RepID=A0A8J8MIE6_9FIRM|nr:hypothetical protein [Vallitalea pronyensis]QUI22012.1 hypothetical protein HZI73_06715 [Vallitalea pronyensis]
MKHNGIAFMTHEHVLIKVKQQPLQVFEIKDYYPDQLPWGFKDIFDEPEVLFHVMKAIMKRIPRSLGRLLTTRNRLLLFIIDSLHSNLRKRLIEESLYQANFGIVIHIDVGPIAVAAAEKRGYETQYIVVAVIGQVIELSFCFGGITVIKQVINDTLSSEFDAFMSTCKKLQDKDIIDLVDTTGMPQQDMDTIRRMWNEKRGIQVIIASNNNSFDYGADREIRYDHKVSFSQMMDLVQDI